MQEGKRPFKVQFTFTNGAHGEIDPLTIPNEDWDVHQHKDGEGNTKEFRTYRILGTEMYLIDFGDAAVLPLDDAAFQSIVTNMMKPTVDTSLKKPVEPLKAAWRC